MTISRMDNYPVLCSEFNTNNFIFLQT